MNASAWYSVIVIKRSFLVLILLLSICPVQAQKKLKQGIHGKVFWIEGNQMPGRENKTSAQEGVQREIFVYEATRMGEATETGGFYTSLPTKLVSQHLSNPDGSFKILLPPGTYSVFVKEPNGLFANLYDTQNFINPVTVKSKAFTWLTIAIDYQAAY